MSRLYFLWAGPGKDQAHLELTETELKTIISWWEFKDSELGSTNEERSLIDNLEEMEEKNVHRLIK